ncbi:hypothetical protein PSPO01_07938 [Paraphaeosphaeria sporulosa]
MPQLISHPAYPSRLAVWLPQPSFSTAFHPRNRDGAAGRGNEYSERRANCTGYYAMGLCGATLRSVAPGGAPASHAGQASLARCGHVTIYFGPAAASHHMEPGADQEHLVLGPADRARAARKVV